MATATALQNLFRGIVGPEPPSDVRLHAALEAIDAQITPAIPLKEVLAALDRTKKQLFKALRNTAAP